MSPRQYLREFISDRLTAAAAEIFGAFEGTIDGYERELQRQREELAVLRRKAQDVPQQNDRKDEVLAGQHLEPKSGLDHVGPQSSLIIEDVDKVTSGVDVPLLLKLEDEALMPALDSGGGGQSQLGGDQQLLPLGSPAVGSKARGEDYQRKRRDAFWQPKIILQRIELPQLQVSVKEEVLTDHRLLTEEILTDHQLLKEEVLTDHQLLKEEVLTDHQFLKEEVLTDHWLVKEEVLTDHQFLKEEVLTDHRLLKEEVLTDHQLCQPHGDQNHQEIGQKSQSFMDSSAVMNSYHEESDHMDPESECEDQLLFPVPERQDQAQITPWEMTHPTEERSNIEQNRHISKPHSCSISNKSYESADLLNIHTRNHTDNKPFSCDVCDKSFNSRSGLKEHMISHTGKKKLACKTCGKCFQRTKALVTHRRTHPNENPHTCELCDTSVRTGLELQAHINTHSEKPMLCNICNKLCKGESDFVAHMKTHGEHKTPFSCEFCHTSFPSKSSLKKHSRTEPGDKLFACKVCFKSFCAKCALTKHMRAHTSVKPFACETCGKCFGQMGYLKAHARTHTGEKPFVCTVCHKSYTRKVSFVAHLRTHADEDPFIYNACGIYII